MYGPMSSWRTGSLTASPSVSRANAIVVATDSARGHELARARLLARENGASLHVLRTSDSARRHADAISVAEAAEDTRAVLIVVGARPQRAVTKSFTERVHDVANAPVLHVRRRAVAAYPRVVVAVAPTSALREMKVALRFVAPSAETIEYVHAFEPRYEPALIFGGMPLAQLRHHRRDAEEAARERIVPLLDRANADARALRLELGRPADVLRVVSPRTLLVVNRGRSWLERTLLGSVTRAILHGVGPDVLVV